MNTWIFKMVAWHRHFALDARRLERTPSRNPGRAYWDRRTRTWNLSRGQVYAFVEAPGRGTVIRSKSKW
jgi:hypothetical protein